jgi:hypothetical protein
LEAILGPFSRFRGYSFSDAFFHLHTICTKIPLPYAAAHGTGMPPFKSGLRHAGQSRRGGLCEKKKEKNKARKVGKAQRPPEVKPSSPQFLCVYASLRDKKK